MSKEKPPAKPDAAAKPDGAGGGEAAAKKGGLPVKTIGAVGVIMLLEAAAIVAVFSMLGPKSSQAEVAHAEIKDDAAEKPQEIMIVEDKFQNLQQGKVWYWDISVYVQVKQKNATQVENILKQRNAEIKEGLGQIIARAQPAQLKEPDRQTLSRQMAAYLGKVFGNDADGHALVDRILIPRCRGIPGEF
jgi:flagellar basal body-associated protein FliL